MHEFSDMDIPPVWNCLFNLMKQWADEHPGTTDDEAFEAICNQQYRFNNEEHDDQH